MTPEQAVANLTRLRKQLPLLIGAEIVSFALDNFDRQGFAGVPWPERKDGSDPGRSVLVGRGSGRGRRSIRVTRHSDTYVEAGTDLEYMAAHNEGDTIQVPITAKSRRFFWAMYYETNDDKWKGMALTKKTVLTIQLPERRFIGPAKELDDRIKALVERKLLQALT